MYGMYFGLGLFIKVVFWILFIILIVALVRVFAGSGHHHMWADEKKSPIDYAKERYAKGEITKSEFETIVKDLK